MRINTQKGIAPIAIIIIVLLVVGGGGYLLQKISYKKEKPTAPAATKTNLPAADEQAGMPVPGTNTEETIVETATPAGTEITIVYDANGFSPQTVTVKKGDTVVFQNKTGKSASIASDPHPTHTIYPEFDQYKTDQRGQNEFRFSFEKVGAWKYHDHLNSTRNGTIIVIE